MSKQTAVEWLVTELRNRISEGTLDAIAISKLKMEAKAMEREQIEEAYYDGQSLNAKSVTSQMIIDNSISYYNETYKGGEQ